MLALAAWGALAAPYGPDAETSWVSGAGIGAHALGGLDTLDGGAVLDLALGLGVQRSSAGGAWAAAYSGGTQAWSTGALLDGHAADAWLRRGGRVGGTGGIEIRGSGALQWGEGSALAGVDLQQRSVRVRVVGGLDGRGGGGASAIGPVGDLRAVWQLDPRLSVEGRLRGAAWSSLPATVQGGVGVDWTPVPSVRASASAWTLSTAGAHAEALAGLPPSGTTATGARAGLDVELSSGWWLRAEAAVEAGRGALVYDRVTAVAGVAIALDRVRTPPPPAVGPRTFALEAPAAREVAVVGSFTGWAPVPMAPGPEGMWAVTVPVEPGVHDYVYLVDGERLVPPEAQIRRRDAFGVENGVIVVQGS